MKMTTEVVTTTKAIIDARNGQLSNYADYSLVCDREYDDISLVIGAKWDARSNCYFNAKSLRELAEELLAVADILDGKEKN